jgi:hypothetical protein
VGPRVGLDAVEKRKISCPGQDTVLYRSKRKAIPVTGRGGPHGCEMSRLPHFLDNRLTDGGEVSLTRRPPFTPRKIPGINFC